MSNQCFPSFNFPFTSSVDLQLSFRDYGRTGPLTVFMDDDQTSRCLPQKKAATQNAMVRLHAKKPSLPIKLPNKVCRKFTNFDESFDQGRQCGQLPSYRRRNMANFSTDHADILCESLSSLVSNEVEDLSWVGSSTRYRQRHVSQLHQLVDSIGDDLCDIPPETLGILLEGSFAEEVFESSGGYYGNCLAHQMNSVSGDIVLAYPSGTYMEKLNLSLVEFSLENDAMVVRMRTEHKAFTFPGKICQINMVNECENNPVIAVRTYYGCSFFHCEYGEDHEEQGPAIKVLGNLACNTRPCSVLVNPFIPGEVVVAMETGSVHVWREQNCSLEVAKKCSACSAEEFEWYFCEFGPHPRQIIRGNRTSVELLDLRENSCAGKDLMTLPSPHFFKGDQISAVQRHPENPYHYFLGTNQFLAIMDERFEQNPILKWSHSLLGPIKHINVVPDALACSQDVLLVVGNYKNHEVHCFQYCYGEGTPHSVRVAETTGGLPPRSTLNPWKISSYSDWPDMMDYPNKPGIISAVNKKLGAPLLGLTCIPHEENLSILQLSKEGDLFYQGFTPVVTKLREEREEGQVYFYEEMDIEHTASGGCGKIKPVLAERDQELVQNWLKSIEQDSIEANHSALQTADSCSVDANVVRDKILSNLEHTSQCSLCKDGTHNVETIDENEVFEKCYHCGLDKVVSDKLTRIQKSTETLLTKGYLGITHEFNELKIFDRHKGYSDPLGEVLLKNWISDDQTPINLTGETQDNAEMPNGYTTECPGNKLHQPVLNETINKDLNISQYLLERTPPYVEVGHNSRIDSANIMTAKRDKGERSDEECVDSTPQQSAKKKKLVRVAGF